MICTICNILSIYLAFILFCTIVFAQFFLRTHARTHTHTHTHKHARTHTHAKKSYNLYLYFVILIF